MEDRDFSKYDSVLIIGNGFDLNLGLPTSYTDFLNSEEFEQLIQEENDLCKYLKSKHNLQNWIDIENELTKYSSLSTNEKRKANFHNEFKSLRKQLTKYIDGIKYEDIKKDSLAYKLLCDFSKRSNSLIIDFNYTESSSLILSNDDCPWDHWRISERLIKIHGTAHKDDIIFGVEDKARIKSEHVFLRKAANISYNSIDLTDLFKNARELIFFGHSLGETDHGYFEELFRNACNREGRKEIVIYSYKESGYYQIMEQIDELTSCNLSPFRQRNEVKLPIIQ